jgi:hypothetical protein
LSLSGGVANRWETAEHEHTSGGCRNDWQALDTSAVRRKTFAWPASPRQGHESCGECGSPTKVYGRGLVHSMRVSGGAVHETVKLGWIINKETDLPHPAADAEGSRQGDRLGVLRSQTSFESTSTGRKIEAR